MNRVALVEQFGVIQLRILEPEVRAVLQPEDLVESRPGEEYQFESHGTDKIYTWLRKEDADRTRVEMIKLSRQYADDYEFEAVWKLATMVAFPFDRLDAHFAGVERNL